MPSRIIHIDEIYHDTLDERFWEDFNFDIEVRNKLVAIAKDWAKSLDIEDVIEDIILTGSIVNYTYTETSDLDVHIIVDYNLISCDEEVLIDAFKAHKFEWENNHSIKIRNADVELYVEDANNPGIASGSYSLLYDKWILKPRYDLPVLDMDHINTKIRSIIDIFNGYEKLMTTYKTNLDDLQVLYGGLGKFVKKLHKYRQAGLNAHGEMSSSNIIYKQLRKNGIITKLYDMSAAIYDMYYEEDSEDIYNEFNIQGVTTIKDNPTANARKNFNVVTKEHRRASQGIPSIEQLKKVRKGRKVISKIEGQKICNMYNISDLTSDNPRNIGSTGIELSINPATKCYVLTKNL